jgi:hypothetical protein
MWEQGTEALSLAIQPASCPVCQKGLYRNITFLTGGWARCAVCSEIVHYNCLSGPKFFKHRPRVCEDCKAGRIRAGQKMPGPPLLRPPAHLANPVPEAASTAPQPEPTSSQPVAPAP